MKRIIISIFILLSFSMSFGQTPNDTLNIITVMQINGAIGPVSVKEIKNNIRKSEKLNAQAMIIEMNTPGGQMESTWDIIQMILASNVPIVVYVYPPGGRAASAGVYITYAAHIAAMAPQTNMGSAHPVGMGGEKIDSTMNEKITNDAVAKIKTLAKKRNRNIEWAEEAVRKSVSVTEFEAKDKNIINFVATNLDSLISMINGDTVELITGQYVIHTANAKVVPFRIGFSNSILEVLSDPNIAYILMAIGMLGLYFEFSNPGAILPGVMGGIALIMALFSFQALPINFAGVLLIILAMILFLLELKITSHGVLGGGGVLALFLGSLMLVNDTEFPYKGISLSVIIPTVLVFTAFFFLAAYLALKAHKRKVATGSAGLKNEIAVTKSIVGPGGGIIFVHGENWKASSSTTIQAGQQVKIIDVSGMELKVEPIQNN